MPKIWKEEVREVFLLVLSLTALVFGAAMAYAHDQWADGNPIPDWVKSSCCGPADAHHLRPDQVHRVSDEFYKVDGSQGLIPVGRAQPSEDGDYWIFYAAAGQTVCTPGYLGTTATQFCRPQESQSGVYCFFIPMAF